jgi:hypothetical protein
MNIRAFFEEEVLRAKLESKSKKRRKSCMCSPEKLKTGNKIQQQEKIIPLLESLTKITQIPAKCHWHSAIWYINEEKLNR